jgi:REP element-mobilizing transposase RayT
MTRPLRIDVAGGWYHVTTRGTERRVIFPDDGAYTHYLELLEEWTARFAVNVHAYVLMPNHVHLVVETPGANLSTAMQWLNTSYAMWFNRRAGRVGPLFQGRFKAILFDGRSEAWAVTRYVHLNPVRVKGLELAKGRSKAEALGLRAVTRERLERRARTLREFRWSSYGAYAGWKRAPKWLKVETVLAGGRRSQVAGQRKAYREYVEGCLGQMLPESPLQQAVAGLLLGGWEWLEGIRGKLTGHRGEQTAYRRLTRPDWEQVRAAVEHVKGERWEQFRERHGDWGRDLAMYVARQQGGLSLREIGLQAGVGNYYAVGQAISRIRRRLESDRTLRKAMKGVINYMNV